MSTSSTKILRPALHSQKRLMYTNEHEKQKKLQIQLFVKFVCHVVMSEQLEVKDMSRLFLFKL